MTSLLEEITGTKAVEPLSQLEKERDLADLTLENLSEMTTEAKDITSILDTPDTANEKELPMSDIKSFLDKTSGFTGMPGYFSDTQVALRGKRIRLMLLMKDDLQARNELDVEKRWDKQPENNVAFFDEFGKMTKQVFNVSGRVITEAQKLIDGSGMGVDRDEVRNTLGSLGNTVKNMLTLQPDVQEETVELADQIGYNTQDIFIYTSKKEALPDDIKVKSEQALAKLKEGLQKAKGVLIRQEIDQPETQ